MYEDILKKAELDNDEILIYEYLLKNGESTAGQIIKETPLKRGNVYNKLENLVEKGLISEQQKKKKAHFKLEHPSHLQKYIEGRQRKLRQVRRTVQAIIPNIISDYNISYNKPGVHYSEGREGVLQMYEKILNLKDTIYSIEDKGEMEKYHPNFSHQLVEKRIAKKIPIKIICPSTNTNNPEQENALREVHYIPVEQFPFSMNIKICQNKVMMLNFKTKNALGILIENPDIAQSYQTLFNLIWNTDYSKS